MLDDSRANLPGQLLPTAAAAPGRGSRQALVRLGRGTQSPEDRLRVAFGTVALGAGLLLAHGSYLLVRGVNTGIPLPYLPLYEWFPGFQSMRVPSRFPLMAVPALVAVAAFGVREIARLAPSRPALASGAVGLILVESLRSPIPLSHLYDRFDPRDLTALQQVSGPIAWFPIAWPGAFSPYLEAARMLQNTAFVPMVNGYSGFVPPVYEDLQRLDATEPPAIVEPVLARVGVRQFVFDTARMAPASLSEWRAWAGDRLAPLGPSGRLLTLLVVR